MNKTKWGKVGRGTLIAAGSGALTYLATLQWDLGSFTPVVMALIAIALNALKVAKAKVE